MTWNYGIGYRNMSRAGIVVIHNKFHGSFQSKKNISERWSYFCQFAKIHGVKKMENVTRELVILYGQQLQRELEAGLRKSSSSPKNYVSAVNTVMRLATDNQWKIVRPGRDCQISPRKYIPSESKAMTLATHQTAQRQLDERLSILLELQRSFGLRFKESCLLNAKKAFKQAHKYGYISLEAGTKGGRKRKVNVRPGGFQVLEKAAQIQDGRSMIPKAMLYVEFRKECYQKAYELGISFHPERHAYAQERYNEITGAPAPIEAGWKRKDRIERLSQYLNVSLEKAKEIDQAARLRIALELGHSREDVSNAYLG